MMPQGGALVILRPAWNDGLGSVVSGNLRDITIRLHQLVFGEARQTEGKLIDIETGGTALGQTPQGHKAGNWVWDTTEVPSGMTFNPSSLAAARVAADLPDFSGS